MNDRDRISELEEENRQLRTLLVPPVGLPPGVTLTKAQARIFRRLASRQSATYESALFAMSEGRVVTAQTLNVQVFRMRRLLAPLGYKIHTLWGVGYRLEHPAS